MTSTPVFTLRHILYTLLSFASLALRAGAAPLVYEGADGPGQGRHIVLLAGDHEYRSEETLPALARLLAKNLGFKCTVLFNRDPRTGEIVAGNSNMPGMEALETADLAVVFLRFQDFPAEQMKHLDAYLQRGGPVVGLRTATHAFKIGKDAAFARYSYDSKVAGYELGFGHQVLGQTWVGHYGKNHQQSTRITAANGKDTHPILRGVKEVWVQAGGYVGKPTDGEILTLAQPLKGMTPDSPADDQKPPQPSEWTRTYKSESGRPGRVFTSLYGASVDLTNDGYRRLLVNGCLWALGLENAITPDLNVALVGPFKPNPFAGGAYARGIKPESYAGFESPIPANDNTRRANAPKTSATARPVPANASASNSAEAAHAAHALHGTMASGKESALADVPAFYRDPTPFAFQQGNVVAILGNGLPDRFQHDGWMETLLQSALPDQQVRFRNMSASGDRPDLFPRSKGAKGMTEYLQHVKADVVFAFFGYNESYDGADKADEHRKKLVEFVQRTRGSKANGRSFPRIVLFSPIAQEDTRNPNLPDPKTRNAALHAYTMATEAAAREAGVAFVDLFHPSLALYQASMVPLTLNGVHLTAEGNRQLAEVIATALLGRPVKSSTSMSPLRAAVMDKEMHWHNRYRASNGNDIWGGRSQVKYTNDQTNAEVLQQELSMLDVMTANRDPRIWALAQGNELSVNDHNVPAPLVVESNIGGKSRTSNAMKEGVLHYLSGEEGIQQMGVARGFAVNLFADEAKFPQLINPVQMQVDGKGRLWAAVWPTYPKWEPLKPMNDALLIFHDDDQDGRADRVTEFAKVQNPLGFEFWNGGVLVTCMSELIFLRDTNGDDQADERIVMLQGFDTADTHHGANNLIFGPDGGIYWQSGIFMQHNFEHPWGPSLNSTASAMYRFDPRRFTISMHAPNIPNSHGTAFDHWGYQYATDASTGRAFQVRPEGAGFKMTELLKKEVRPVSACEIVSSANFPESMQGDFLICNVIGFRGLKHYRLTRNPDTGAVWGEPAGDELAVTTVKPDGTPSVDRSRGLMMSGDKNFRPSDAIFGADGALYISDWYNPIIGHLQHNARDPNRNRERGRIYRMVYTARPLQKPVAIAGAPLAALLENLTSPVDGVRHRTRVELSGRDTKEVIAAMQQWMKRFDPNRREDARSLLEALWVHQQHNVRHDALLGQLLNSPEPHARFAARTAKHLWFDVEASFRGGVIADEKEWGARKSGIVSDRPNLTDIRIATVPEKMLYDVKELTVQAGKKIRLTFANPDFMPHNIVLVKPGTADAVGEKAMELGARGFDVGFVPESPDILWASKLVDHGKEEVITFTAPTTPGAYPFLCTFPGHHILMRGTLHVK